MQTVCMCCICSAGHIRDLGMQSEIHRMQGLKLLSYTSIFAAMPFQLAIALHSFTGL